MPEPLTAVVLAVFILATSVWIGGYAAIPVFVRTARATLKPTESVALFRLLGRTYARLGTPALIIAYLTGGVLMYGRPWNALLIATIVIAAVLLAALVLGMVQARRMTSLRRASLAAPGDPELQGQVRRGARAAGRLRAALGVLSVILVVLGAFLAV